jgi:hypothetical protein
MARPPHGESPGRLNLFPRTRHQDDAVSLKALPFSTPKEGLGHLIAVYELAP